MMVHWIQFTNATRNVLTNTTIPLQPSWNIEEGKWLLPQWWQQQVDNIWNEKNWGSYPGWPKFEHIVDCVRPCEFTTNLIILRQSRSTSIWTLSNYFLFLDFNPTQGLSPSADTNNRRWEESVCCMVAPSWVSQIMERELDIAIAHCRVTVW